MAAKRKRSPARSRQLRDHLPCRFQALRFEWNVNIGDVGVNPETAYPGDAYVDIIGMDFYWNTAWDPNDPIDAYEFDARSQMGTAIGIKNSPPHTASQPPTQNGASCRAPVPLYITRSRDGLTPTSRLSDLLEFQ